MEFVALDVETANANPGSICQIGMAYFRDGQLVKTWGRRFNPCCDFDQGNIAIHGITALDVARAPRLADSMPAIMKFLDNRDVAAHTMFDRSALASAANAVSLSPPSCRWLDTSLVARRAWREVAQGGYGLANLCRRLGVEFRHHDAVEDAVACGKVLLAACEASNISTRHWFDELGVSGGEERVKRTPRRQEAPKWLGKKVETAEPNQSGVLYGERIVFTGELSMDRQTAATLAAEVGCTVTSAVSRKTTIVVIGRQDPSVIKGDKSSKHLKAEELAAQGYPIRILREEEFMALVQRV